MVDEPSLIGFEAIARDGRLGTVVEARRSGRHTPPDHLIVCGGMTELLYYHVPTHAIMAISPTRQAIAIALDARDFYPRLCQDGSVDLFIG